MFPGVVFSLLVFGHFGSETIFRNTKNQRCLKAEVLSRAIEYANIGINNKQVRSQAKIQVRWNPPPTPPLLSSTLMVLLLETQDWLEDEILFGMTKEIWIKGYARAIGTTTSVATELWALRDGIRLCIALKIPAVIIELDAQVVVDLLKKNASHPNGIGALVNDCKNGLREIPMVQIRHCYWETNKCADTLARRGAFLSQDFVIFLDPSIDVLFLLSLDVVGMHFDRFVLLSFIKSSFLPKKKKEGVL